MREILSLSSSAIVAGALVMMIFCRLLMLWQQDRTWRAVWFLAMYASLLALFVAQAVNAPVGVVNGLNALLFVVLSVCTGYEWRDFREVQRKKNIQAVEPVTLRDLAEDDGTVAKLEAVTETEVDDGD